MAWTLWVLLAATFGLVTAGKSRWGWFWAGFPTAGVAWIIGAFQLANPSSLWAGRFYGPEKTERAILAYLRAGAIDQ